MFQEKILQYLKSIKLDSFAEGTQIVYVHNGQAQMFGFDNDIKTFVPVAAPEQIQKFLEKNKLKAMDGVELIARYNTKNHRFKILNILAREAVMEQLNDDKIDLVKGTYRELLDAGKTVGRFDGLYMYCNSAPCTYDGKISYDVCYALTNLLHMEVTQEPIETTIQDDGSWDPKLNAVDQMRELKEKM